MAPLLEIRQLCKDFASGGIRGKSRRVLDGVNMTVNPGETVGVVGESGCGKTTLARCILRLTEPTAGSVLIDGCDLAGLSGAELREKRRDFQMVFQDPSGSLHPRMSIGEILMEPLRVNRIGTPVERQRRIQELLEAVSLDDSILARKPAELSGGQQQRVGIARWLALKPRLLIADEPVSALDVSVQAQILNLLGDLKRRFDFTLILISHSLYAVHYLCTRVVVMCEGRIIEDTPASAFFERPSHPHSRMLLNATPRLDGADLP